MYIYMYIYMNMIMCIYIYLWIWSNMCIIYVYVVFMNLFPIPLIYRLDMSVSQKKQCLNERSICTYHIVQVVCFLQEKWCLGNRGKWDTAFFVRHSCLFKTLYHQAHHHTPHHLGHRTWWWTSTAKDKWWVGIDDCCNTVFTVTLLWFGS